MEFEPISALVDGKQLKTIESIIQALAQKIPQLIFTPFKYGKIGDEILVHFKINQEFHQFMIEKLTINGINVVTQDEKTKEYIDSVKTQMKKSGSGGLNHWVSKHKPESKEKKTIEELTEEGDYIEVIKISRTVTLPKEEVDRARLNIDKAILRAINVAFSEAYTKKIDVQKNINRLIMIASDNDLKTLQKTDFLKEAGLLAVKICSQRSDYLTDLIPICNNNKLHHLICVKAAIAFYDIAFKDKDLFTEEIVIAKRKLNTRWLLIAINTVEPDLTPFEKKSFDTLIEFMTANRA